MQACGPSHGEEQCSHDATERDSREPMDVKASTSFRRAVARLNHLALDRADIGVATNHLARMVAQPRIGDEVAFKRVGRYLKGRPICKVKFEIQEPCTMITAYTDGGWAGCRLTRRSTSGSAVSLGKHVLKFACKLQKIVALSSGEAKLCAQSAGQRPLVSTVCC